MALDIATLQAALIGYQAKHDEITAKMADIRKRIHGGDEPFPLVKGSPRKKRKMSAAGRKAISEATKKRWAEYHKAKKKAEG